MCVHKALSYRNDATDMTTATNEYCIGQQKMAEDVNLLMGIFLVGEMSKFLSILQVFHKGLGKAGDSPHLVGATEQHQMRGYFGKKGDTCA